MQNRYREIDTKLLTILPLLKTKVVNLVLKYFLIKLYFYTCNFKIQFCQLAHFTRKLVQGYKTNFWTHFSRYKHYMVILMLVGVRCHNFNGGSVNLI